MMITVLALFNFTIFTILSTLHLYWVLGGVWGLRAVVPTDGNGRLLFRPGRSGTFIVAMGLFAFALLNLAFSGYINVAVGKDYWLYGIRIIGTIFLLRSIGDFRYVGFTKRYRQTEFARNDSRLYSPLCLVLGLMHWMMVFL